MRLFNTVSTLLILSTSWIGLTDLSGQEVSDRAASLDYIEKDDQLVAIIRPSLLIKERAFRDLLKSGAVKKLIEGQSRQTRKMSGVDVEDVDQITIISNVDKRDSLTIIRTRKKQGFDSITETATEKEAEGVKYHYARRSVNGMRYFHVADDQTIVWSSDVKSIEALGNRRRKSSANQAPWRVTWRNFENDRVIFIYGQKMFEELKQAPFEKPYTELVKPILTGKYLMGSLAIEEEINLFAEMQLGDRETASEAKKSLEEIARLTRASLSEIPEDAIPESQRPMIEFSKTALKTHKVKQEGDRLVGSVKLDFDLKEMVELLASQFSGAARVTSANNARQIGIAMHTYHDANKSLPPAVYVSENGQKHSWRVRILPYLGETELYNRYRFDEPWNSRHNKEVTASIPEVYKHPDSDPDSLDTNYFVVVGDGAVFDGEKGFRLQEIADGTSRTIMIIEGKQNTHWAKPEDVPFEARRIKATMGGFTEGGTNVVFCDCSVRFVADSIDREVLYKLFTRNGGDTVDLSKIDGGR